MESGRYAPDARESGPPRGPGSACGANFKGFIVVVSPGHPAQTCNDTWMTQANGDECLFDPSISANDGELSKTGGFAMLPGLVRSPQASRAHSALRSGTPTGNAKLQGIVDNPVAEYTAIQTAPHVIPGLRANRRSVPLRHGGTRDLGFGAKPAAGVRRVEQFERVVRRAPMPSLLSPREEIPKCPQPISPQTVYRAACLWER
jgi:hypothetical protein